MIALSHFKSTTYILACALLFFASCSSDDSFIDFTDDGDLPVEEYSFCTDQSNYEAGKILTTNDLVGEYVKTRELVCGISGCEEAPFVRVQFAGINPTLTLTANGAISNPDGIFADFETWTILAPVNDEAPHSFEFRDTDGTEDTFQVTILEAGPCRLRVQNVQGWVEFVRLEKL